MAAPKVLLPQISEDRISRLPVSLEVLALVAMETENGVVITDSQGLTQWVNPSFTRITGYTLAEVQGRKLGHVLQGPEANWLVLQYMRSELRAGRGFKVDVQNCHKNGEPIWLELEVKPIRDVAGQIVHYMGIQRDITQRRLLDETLESSSRQYRAVVEHLKEVIFQTDLEGNWTFLNPAWSELMGYSREVTLGTQLMDYIHPESRAGCGTSFSQLMTQQRKDCRHEVRFLTKGPGESYRWMEVYARALINEEGKICGATGSLNDIMDRKQAELRLQETNRLQCAILKAAHASIISTTPEGLIQTFNPAAERMLGYSASEMIGKATPALFHDPAEVAKRATELSQNLGIQVSPGFKVFITRPNRDMSEQSEWTYIRKDGTRFPVTLTVTPLRNEAGELTGYLGMAVDITESRRMVEALRASEEKNRLIIDTALDAVVTLDRQGVITGWNRQAELTFGWSMAEATGRKLSSLLSAESAVEAGTTGLEGLLRRQERLGGNRRLEVTAVRRDGLAFPMELTLAAMPTGEGYTYSAFMRDISEARQVQEALQEQQSLLANIISTLPLFVFWKDRSSRYVGCNPAFAKVAGLATPEEIRGKTDYELPWSRTEAETFVASDQAVMSSGVALIGAKELHPLPQGQFRHVEISKIPLRDGRGEVIGLVGVYVDVTQRHEAEIELRQAKEAAEAANHAKSTFLATMSHEIRTPLNGVAGTLSLLENSPLNDQQQQFLQVAQASAKTLLTLINDILDFSKIEAGRMEIESISFPLPELMEQLSLAFTPQFVSKGVALTYDLAPEVTPRRMGDPMRLRQVLTNLVGNALKFTTAGQVHLRCQMAPEMSPPNPDFIKFEVVDTGIGIAADRVDRLFQSFSQVDSSTTRKYGGTGLGLAISHHLVQMMGGELSVSSTPGQGSTFSFTIYLPQAQLDQTAPRPELTTKPVAVAGLVPPLRILLAEDNEINQLVLREFLKREGYGCVVVNNGAAAVAATAEQTFDLVFLDCQMPVMDGFEACRQIRAREGKTAGLNKRLFIVALTANALTGDREVCIAAGMDEYLVKPLEVQELQRLLQQVQKLIPPPATRMELPVARALPQATAPIDVPALRKLYAPELLTQLLEIFEQQAVQTLEKLREGVATQDLTALAGLAHKLRGSARFVAAEPVALLTLEIEALTQAGKVTELTQVIDNLRGEIERCQRLIPEIIAGEEVACHANQQPLTKEGST